MSDDVMFRVEANGAVSCGWCGKPIDKLMLDTGPPRRQWNEPCRCTFPRPADPPAFPRLRLFRRIQ